MHLNYFKNLLIAVIITYVSCYCMTNSIRQASDSVNGPFGRAWIWHVLYDLPSIWLTIYLSLGLSITTLNIFWLLFLLISWINRTLYFQRLLRLRRKTTLSSFDSYYYSRLPPPISSTFAAVLIIHLFINTLFTGFCLFGAVKWQRSVAMATLEEEMKAGIAAFNRNYHQRKSSYMEELYQKSLIKVQKVQTALRCCGLQKGAFSYDIEDWRPSSQSFLVPFSCCAPLIRDEPPPPPQPKISSPAAADKADKFVVLDDQGNHLLNESRFYSHWYASTSTFAHIENENNFLWDEFLPKGIFAFCEISDVPKNRRREGGNCLARLEHFYFKPLFRWLKQLFLLHILTVFFTLIGGYLFWKVKV